MPGPKSEALAKMVEAAEELLLQTGHLFRFHVQAIDQLLADNALRQGTTPDRNIVAAAVRDGRLELVNMTEVPTAGRGLASHDGSLKVFGLPRGYIVLKKGTNSAETKIHAFAVTGLALSADGHWVASSSAGGTLDIRAAEKLWRPEVAANGLRRFASGLTLVLQLAGRRVPGDYPITQVAVAPWGKAKPAVVALTESGNLQYAVGTKDWKKQKSGIFSAVTVNARGSFWLGTA